MNIWVPDDARTGDCEPPEGATRCLIRAAIELRHIVTVSASFKACTPVIKEVGELVYIDHIVRELPILRVRACHFSLKYKVMLR